MLDSKTSGVRVEVTDAVARLTLTRPSAGNALGDQTGRELRAALEALEKRDDVRCLLIVAEGKAFCVGGDLVEFSQLDPLAPAIHKLVGEFHAACEILARLSFPIVSVVQGATAGAGLALVALSDIAFASPNATFTYAYPKVGFSSDGGLIWLLPRLIGIREFQQFALLGKSLSAEDALSLGLISKIVKAEDLEAAGHTMATQLAGGPTLAFGEIRKMLFEGLGATYSDHLIMEQAAIVRLSDSEDTRVAIPSILSRQVPAYSGR